MSLPPVLSSRLEVCSYVNSLFKLTNITDPNQNLCLMVSCFDWQWANLFYCRMFNKALPQLCLILDYHWSFKWTVIACLHLKRISNYLQWFRIRKLWRIWPVTSWIDIPLGMYTVKSTWVNERCYVNNFVANVVW